MNMHFPLGVLPCSLVEQTSNNPSSTMAGTRLCWGEGENDILEEIRYESSHSTFSFFFVILSFPLPWKKGKARAAPPLYPIDT